MGSTVSGSVIFETIKINVSIPPSPLHTHMHTHTHTRTHTEREREGERERERERGREGGRKGERERGKEGEELHVDNHTDIFEHVNKYTTDNQTHTCSIYPCAIPPNRHSISTSWLTVKACPTAMREKATRLAFHYKPKKK